jgi:hypothetical protein
MKFGVVVFAPHEIFDFAGTPHRLRQWVEQ